MTKIAIIGIGMGNTSTLTVEARDFIQNADLLIGASRMLQSVSYPGQNCISEYKPDKIAETVAANKDSASIAILMSGDVGFYSGAAKLLNKLDSVAYDLTVMPGISSVVYFASKLHMSWQDIVLTSLHGRACNLIGEIHRAPKVFSILGTTTAAGELCQKLLDYGMDDCTVHVGQDFGYDTEKIISGSPAELLSESFSALSVVIVENPHPQTVITHGIPDEEFLRDKVPMTKEEVREISISKLRLAQDSVIYDIGAGSGSVSIEAALQAFRGKVYAIEKNETALQLLEKNKLKFRADNMEIIAGLAPDAMTDLPTPTHAFIGGSSGNMQEIVRLLLKKNPNIRLVMNAITLETVHEMMQVVDTLPFTDVDIASVSTAKSKKVGAYHMMMGQNPVYIVSATGDSEVQS